MARRKMTLSIAAGLAALVTSTTAWSAPVATAQAATSSSLGHIQQLTYRGTVNVRDLARAASSASATAGTHGPEVRAQVDKEHALAAGSGVPNPPTRRVTTDHPGVSGFIGITGAQSRLADDGNNFSAEPPDQGLCAGNGFMLEAINLAVTVYADPSFQLTPVISLNRFFGLAPAIDRTKNPPIFGPFLSDPRCHYDPETGRWFLTTLEIDLNPFTGAFGQRSATLVAVSQTNDPTGAYTIYSIDTTDDGNGTPRHPGCPCLGDFPMIGSDANGFYITTREFGLNSNAFNGGQIYAVSKKMLAANSSGANPTLPPVVHLQAGALAGGLADRLMPAVTPPGGTYAPNREYFLTTTNTLTASSNSIAIYALSNTASLSTAKPSLALSHKVLPAKLYTSNPKQQQRPGPRPLGKALGEPLPPIDAGIDATFRSTLSYTGGFLAGALPTGVGSGSRPTSNAALWLIVKPTFSGGRVGGAVVRSGYVRAAGADVAYPSVAVKHDGTGAMVFTVIGPNTYPSIGEMPFSLAKGATGPIRLVARGSVPEDGISCYPVDLADPGYRGCRWGDYTAAVATRNEIRIAGEFTPRTSRSTFLNFGTFIGRVR